MQNATNERTFVGAIVPPFPCGNTLPVLTTGEPTRDATLLAVLSSFVVDRVLRLKMSQNHVNLFYVEELPLPPMSAALEAALASAAARVPALVDRRERIDLRARMDAAVALAFGLRGDDLAVLVRDCDRPVEALRKPRGREGLDPKGFWRVDRDLEPSQRQTARAVSSCRELEGAGEAAVVAMLAR